MMLARVADSLYWIGRYVERAEHMCRLSDVMLNATLDRTEASAQVARIALAAVGDNDPSKALRPYDAALALALDREDGGSITSSIALARENARQGAGPDHHRDLGAAEPDLSAGHRARRGQVPSPTGPRHSCTTSSPTCISSRARRTPP